MQCLQAERDLKPEPAFASGQRNIVVTHFDRNLLQILLYMARAYHDAGDHLASKSCLLRAIHLAPSNIKMRFDLAFVLQVGC